MHFVQHQQRRALAPALRLDGGAVGGHIKVEVLAARPFDYQLLAQRGLAHLARSSEHHHLVLQVNKEKIAEW